VNFESGHVPLQLLVGEWFVRPIRVLREGRRSVYNPQRPKHLFPKSIASGLPFPDGMPSFCPAPPAKVVVGTAKMVSLIKGQIIDRAFRGSSKTHSETA